MARNLHRECRITVFGEEPRAAYDRVHLSSFFEGKSAAELSLVPPGYYEQAGMELLAGGRAIAIDRARRAVTAASGRAIRFDRLVLATGSFPFVPPIPGRVLPGCFVYRTIEDLDRDQHEGRDGQERAGESRTHPPDPAAFGLVGRFSRTEEEHRDRGERERNPIPLGGLADQLAQIGERD